MGSMPCRIGTGLSCVLLRNNSRYSPCLVTDVLFKFVRITRRYSFREKYLQVFSKERIDVISFVSLAWRCNTSHFGELAVEGRAF
jgi:hypothetical protein